jgi:RNA-directed DNA polymerase
MTLISTLARETGISVKSVERIVKNAPKRYKIYTIPKRNGGERIIAQPAVEVKALQKTLMMRVLASLPVHDAAFAYVRGRSIRHNALRHAKSDVLLKLDFKNFFNSIRPVDLERVLRARGAVGIAPSDYETIYQICFWGLQTPLPLCLSVGAPSSPLISNIVMYEFDRSASEAASELGVNYTRYADDITVSSTGGRGPLLKFERRLQTIIRQSRLSLALNDSKRGIYGRGERRMVTGLIITPDGAVSIGRERKRQIRAALHRVRAGEATDRLLMHCKGMLAFVISAEPLFMRSLINHVGREVVQSVLRTPQLTFYRDDASLELD